MSGRHGFSSWVGGLVRCEECHAVVADECSDLHREWHDRLRRDFERATRLLEGPDV